MNKKKELTLTEEMLEDLEKIKNKRKISSVNKLIRKTLKAEIEKDKMMEKYNKVYADDK